MASVVNIASVLRENDMKVLYVEYNIPQEIAFCVPGKDDRAFLLLTGFVTALQIPIAQFHANDVRYLCSLCIFLRQHLRLLTMSMVPEVYTGAPSEAETASLGWMIKLVEDNLGDFQRNHLVSRVEAKKAEWGPPSPVQKLKIPLHEVLQRKKRKKGFIIGPRSSDASPPSPR
ncbi:hypothetical protein Nepgr_019251 [Nepenthes gracilis]|uniref:Uncharacterized protein n=1 Tax=Nepenthes gracilis TaxID=150966 RepID=A0AAD3SUT8_NEPGR|nr:hypothetical protein Nepgr_019251 [Nepenthes gracilis]